MGDARDSEAISAYLTDLQGQVRTASPTLSAAIHVLAEPLSFLSLLPDVSTHVNVNAHSNANAGAQEAVTEFFPRWRGPLEPTTARRAYFIQHLLPNHLNFILDTITVDWLNALPSAERVALFDTYFVPKTAALRQHRKQRRSDNNNSSSVTHNGNDDGSDSQWGPLMAVVSLQTLVNRINAQFHQNHSVLNNTILRLLRRLIDVTTLQDFYTGCCMQSSTSSLISAGAVDITLWDAFLSKLFSIPTRISNAFGVRTEVEESFRETLFFKRQVQQLQMCLEGLSTLSADVRDKNKDKIKVEEQRIQLQAKAFAVVIAKIQRLGYSKILAESVMSTLWSTSDSTKVFGWKQALLHATSPGTAQLFLTSLVDHLNHHQLNFSDTKISAEQQQLAVVLRAAHILISLGYGTSEKANNNQMVQEVLFQGRVFGTGVLRTLICVQSGWPSRVRSNTESALGMTFKKALEVWSDAMLINHASLEYQRYISYQVLLMVGYFDYQGVQDLDLIPIFGAGMTTWLDIENFQRKRIVLVVAEEFSRVVDTIGSPADFGLDGNDPEVVFARSLVHLQDGKKPYNLNALASTDSTADGSKERRTKTSSQQHGSADSDSDEEDPIDIIPSVASAPTSGKHDSDDNDSEDDDLKPYEIEYESDPDEDAGSVKRPKVAAPLYLRDLLSYIRAGDDRDKTEMGIKSAADLIRRKAGSLELDEFAEALATAFVVLNDNFDLSDFYKMKENALVALAVTCPVKVAGVLTAQFYEKKNSMGQRLNVLTALALGAQELSGYDRPPSAVQPPSSPMSAARRGAGSLARNNRAQESASPWSSTSTLVGARPTFDSMTSSISLARTRRFSQKSNIEASRAAPKANAFSNVAPVFLGGLLGRWGGNRGAGMERGYDVLQKAPAIVLKKFVMTLGVLVHYTGNSPHLLAITRELFRFLLVLRYHSPPAQATPRPAPPPPAIVTSMASLDISAPSLTSLKLPGSLGNSAGVSGALANVSSASLPYNPDLLESILFDLLILVTPSTHAISDELMVHEFYAEIMECQQWAMELWEVYKQDPDSADKSRMYCAGLLQRCFELMKVSM